MPLYFNERHLPEPSPEYVVWVDVMGIQAIMSRSLAISANFIFKLHTAALEAPNADAIIVYPIMDGFYASSPNQRNILDFLRNVFRSVADEVSNQAAIRHRFIIRGGLAFGPVIHGRSVPEQASRTMHNNDVYRNSLLLGLPMVQANASERLAPPFGIFVHESARSFAPPNEGPLRVVWWEWGDRNNQVWCQMDAKLTEYYDWCAARAGAIEYDQDRIESHRLMMKQYFVEDAEVGA